MAGNRIKGITIQIGGDTTGLKKALSDVDKQLNTTQSALKDVNRLLKLDPKNTALLSQKHKLLADAIAETEDRLETLKEADKQAKKQLESGELGREQYDALQREIIETEQKLKSLKEEASSSSKSLSNSFEKMGNKAKAAGESLKPLSTAAAAIAGAALATVPATEELRTDLSRLDQNARDAGVGIDKTRKAFEAFNVISDEVDSSVEATSNLLQAGFSESNLQKAVEGLTGAYLRFPDTLKIESLSDSLQETLATNKATGQFGELLDRLGIGADNFSEKLQTMSTEAEKQNYVLETLANAGLTDTYKEYKKNNEALIESKQANYDFQEATAELAEVLVPIITKITELATGVLNWFNNLSPAAKNVIIVLVAIMAILAPLLVMIGNTALGISNLITAVRGMTWIPEMITKISGVFKSLFIIIAAHPIIAIITAIIAVIVLLYTKCEWFRNGVNAIIKKVISFFTNLGTSIANIGSKAITAISNMVSGIRTKVSTITGIIRNGFQGAISFITSLPGKAIGWGKDFIQGMINGIKAKISGIVGAVKGVAEKISSFLHFSRPDEGPLHYYEEWMPDFMDGLTNGIYANLPKVARAAESIADTLNLGNMKTMKQNGLDPDAIYGAVRSGASDAERPLILDGRRLDRGLKERGVVFA